MNDYMHDTFDQRVREFMDAFQQPYLKAGVFGLDNFPTEDVLKARMAMLLEEMDELEEAERIQSDVGILDAIVDIMYVMYGGALECGVEHRDIGDDFRRPTFKRPAGDEAFHYSYVIRHVSGIVRPRIDLFGQELFYKAFMEVHRSNMSKIWSCKPLVQSDEVVIVQVKDGWILKRNGKVVKPPTYSKANLAKILEESGYRYRKKLLASF